MLIVSFWPSAKAILLIVSILVLLPRSILAMVDCGTCDNSASSR